MISIASYNKAGPHLDHLLIPGVVHIGAHVLVVDRRVEVVEPLQLVPAVGRCLLPDLRRFRVFVLP